MIARYRQRFPSAMKCKEETLEACLQALRLPAAHHKRLRTSNLLERTFGEHKRRTKVIPHFFTEEAAMKLSFAVLLAVANKWHGVRMDVFAARKVEELRNEASPARHVGGISSLTERGEPYGDLTGKLRLDLQRSPAASYADGDAAGLRFSVSLGDSSVSSDRSDTVESTEANRERHDTGKNEERTGALAS